MNTVQTEGDSESIQQLFERMLREYRGARQTGGFGRNHPLWKSFALLADLLEHSPSIQSRPTLRVKWSVGKGNWAGVSWIAIIDSRETDAPKGGIYCVFLFREDMTGVYSTLNQGVTKPRADFGASAASEYLKGHASRIRAVLGDLEARHFLLDDAVDLRSAGLGESYEESTIAYKLYAAGTVPRDEEIEGDLEALLSAYDRALDSTPKPQATWIFQANPDYFDIEGAVSQLKEMKWLVATQKERIKPGDRVFIWKSGPDAGIVADATVLTEPALQQDNPESLVFAVAREKFDSLQLRVSLRINRPIEPVLSRSVLKADPRLADLSILRFSQGTNFPVTSAQADVIQELIDAGPPDADEIPAAAPDSGVTGGARVWAYAPGPKAQFWEDFYRDEIMAIGWDELEDLRKYPDHQSIARKLIDIHKLEGQPVNDSRACDDFVHVMKPGDRVIAKKGRDEVVGYGIVIGDYEYRPERPSYRHVRQVRWERRGSWKCEPIFAVKTLTDFTRFPEEVEYLLGLIGVSEAAESSPLPVRCVSTTLRHSGMEFREYFRLSFVVC